ncbi:MAG: CRTAC1 family protein [Planctomycetaceae bacterium]
MKTEAAPKNSAESKPAIGSDEPEFEGLSFSDVAPTMGIDFRFFEDRVPGRYLLPEVMGGGVGWADFDRDGWLDLYFCNGTVLDPRTGAQPPQGSRVYRSRRGKTFFDASDSSGALNGGYGQGVAPGDFNADGFADVFVSNYGADVLYQSNGDGTFVNVTAEAKIGDPLWSTSAAWLDADSDGDLDLYCANYMDVTLSNNHVCYYGDKPGYCGPGTYQGLRDALWLNSGDGSFREASNELGMAAQPSKGLAVCVIDLDRDLRPEVYVANDMEANLLFTRSKTDKESGNKWNDIAVSAGAAVGGDGLNEASMGIAAADYDNDGLPDLYLTHYYQMKNTLYRNLGGLLFEDDSLRTGVAATSYSYLGFGAIPLDANSDGRMDVFVANGHVLGPAIEPNAMTPQLLLNQESGFKDASARAGSYFTDAWIGRGVAGGDFDNDGDLDIAVSHIDRPVALLRNDCRRESTFLGIELHDENRILPVGARVRVFDGKVWQEQSQSAGGSYLSTGDSRLLFSVPQGSCEIEITWPDSSVSKFTDIQSGRYYRAERSAVQELAAQ